jgi:hypothetical protein
MLLSSLIILPRIVVVRPQPSGKSYFLIFPFKNRVRVFLAGTWRRLSTYLHAKPVQSTFIVSAVDHSQAYVIVVGLSGRRGLGNCSGDIFSDARTHISPSPHFFGQKTYRGAMVSAFGVTPRCLRSPRCLSGR